MNKVFFLLSISKSYPKIFNSYKLDESSNQFQKQTFAINEDNKDAQKEKDCLDCSKKIEIISIFDNFVNVKSNDEILQMLDFISFSLVHYDLSFLTIAQINSFFIQCFSFIHEDLYLEQILLCFSSFSFQSFEINKILLDLKIPFFEFFFDQLFSQKHDSELILNVISCFSKQNILIQKQILSVLLAKGGFHSILRLIIDTCVNENKVISFSKFLYSISLYPIYSIEAYDDIFECIDMILQSHFESSFLPISQAVQNILYQLFHPNYDIQNLDDAQNELNFHKKDDVIESDNKFFNFFSNDIIDYIIDSFNNHLIIENLFSKIDDNEDMAKHICVSIGLLRYRCNINEKIDLGKIVDLINSSNDEIIICSSRCFADFCYLDPSYSQKFLNIEYFICLLKKFELFSMQNKVNSSFQIVIFSNFLPLYQLFELCKKDCNEICLMSIFAQIVNTMSVFLLHLLLKIVINIFEYSISEGKEKEINKEEFLVALRDIQSTDIFCELEKTEIPEMISMILEKFI